MKTGTGGLKDGTGTVLVICNSESEGQDVARYYRAVDQVIARFDFISNEAEALLATEIYMAGANWCVAADTPQWFSDVIRERYNRTFGAQSHTSQLIATYTDEYAINPKELNKP